MTNARLDELQAGIKISGRNINLWYTDNTTLMAESKEELKSLLMRVKEKSEHTNLKLNINKTKILASGPITSWQIEDEKVEQWHVSFSWALKPLLMVTETMKLDDYFLARKLWKTYSMLKSKNIPLPTKAHIVKAMVFPVIMYRC